MNKTRLSILRKGFELQALQTAKELFAEIANERASTDQVTMIDANFIDYLYYQGLLSEDEYEKKNEAPCKETHTSGWDLLLDLIDKRIITLAKRINKQGEQEGLI